MTSDELNYWLCLWYHVRILGKCVHKYGDGDLCCVKCGEPMAKVPDYLSNPAVMWEIVKKIASSGIHALRFHIYGVELHELDESGIWQRREFWFHGKEVETDNQAVMLALKAKVENERQSSC